MTLDRIAYPGTFDPPTIAHLEIARAAHESLGLGVDWVVSREPLGKAAADAFAFEHRVTRLRAVAETHDWLDVAVTDQRFIADIAAGYRSIVLGADKWRQVNDPRWYSDQHHFEQSRSALTHVLVVPRAEDRLDDLRAERSNHVVVLDVDPDLRDISSSAARAGRVDLIVPAARLYRESPRDERTR